MEYRINHKRNLKYLTPFLLGCVAYIAINIYAGFSGAFYILVSIVFILSGVIPIMLTHVSYYFKNRKVILKIIDDKSFLYNDKKYLVDDIRNIEMHQTIMRLKKGIQLLPTSDYHYSKVIFKNGDILYITCLLVDDFNLDLSHKVIVKMRITASILFEDVLSF